MMSVLDTYVQVAIGVMSTKRTMRFASVIDAMLFIVAPVMKWISATTVAKWCVLIAVHYFHASSAVVVCAKSAPQRVDGKWNALAILKILWRLETHEVLVQLRDCPVQS